MRSSVFVLATAILVSVVGLSQGRSLEAEDDVMPFSLIDPIVKAILESMRPKVANLKIKDINQTIQHPNLNATVEVKDGVIENLDKFVIKTLKSQVLPLRLNNLTLTWDEVVAKLSYNLNSSAIIAGRGPFNIHGKGDAKAILRGVYLTIGANMELKDKAIQVKPKGLFGFDMTVDSANVTISSLMGSAELGNAVSVFISKMIPDLVNTLKKPVFDAFHDEIIKVVNQVLKSGGKSFFFDEEPSFPELSLEGLDMSEEINTFFNQPELFSSEETEFDL